jgi:hypothetical protein
MDFGLGPDERLIELMQFRTRKLIDWHWLKVEKVAAALMNFIMRDDTSPFAKNTTPEFDGFDIAVATALAEVQDASKARIDHTIEKADSLPR